jgi:hypothetical protein
MRPVRRDGTFDVTINYRYVLRYVYTARATATVHVWEGIPEPSGPRKVWYYRITSEIQSMLYFFCRIQRKRGILYVEVPCPIMGVLHDNFCAFVWRISTPNNSTSDMGTATSVVHVVRLRASYMEQMQLLSRGTLLYICSTFLVHF